MQNFVTLFNAQNVHLIKDVGLIPYGMQRYGLYDACIAAYDNSPYPYFDNEVKGLRLWQIPRISGNFKLDAVPFLIKNSKKIAILNMYHTSAISAVLIFIYKKLNPAGKVYLKLDGGFTKEESAWWQRIFRGYAMMRADYVSCELYSKREQLAASWQREIDVVRDPFLPEEMGKLIPFAERKNKIITVGRLGTRQKNTETLLAAFQKAAGILNNWELELIGPLEKKETDFEKYMERWFECFPDMRSRVKLAGSITDRKKIMALYREAKIFVLPSRWESYGIVLMEAGLAGDFLICSDIPSSRELTADFAFAGHFAADDSDALVRQLLYFCGNENEMELKGKAARKFFAEECELKEVCEHIYDGLNR